MDCVPEHVSAYNVAEVLVPPALTSATISARLKRVQSLVLPVNMNMPISYPARLSVFGPSGTACQVH